MRLDQFMPYPDVILTFLWTVAPAPTGRAGRLRFGLFYIFRAAPLRLDVLAAAAMPRSSGFRCSTHRCI